MPARKPKWWSSYKPTPLMPQLSKGGPRLGAQLPRQSAVAEVIPENIHVKSPDPKEVEGTRSFYNDSRQDDIHKDVTSPHDTSSSDLGISSPSQRDSFCSELTSSNMSLNLNQFGFGHSQHAMADSVNFQGTSDLSSQFGGSTGSSGYFENGVCHTPVTRRKTLNHSHSADTLDLVKNTHGARSSRRGMLHRGISENGLCSFLELSYLG